MKQPSINLSRLEKARVASSKNKAAGLSEQQIADLYSGKIKGGISLTRGENHIFDPALSASENHANLGSHVKRLMDESKYQEAAALASAVESMFRNYAKLGQNSGNQAVADAYGTRADKWANAKNSIQQKIASAKQELKQEPVKSTHESQLHEIADAHRESIKDWRDAHDAAEHFVKQTGNALLPESARKTAQQYAEEFLNTAESLAPQGNGEEELWAQNPQNPDHPRHQEFLNWQNLPEAEKKKTPAPTHPRRHALDHPSGLDIARPDTSETVITPRKVDPSVIKLYSQLLTGNEKIKLTTKEIQERINDLKINNPKLTIELERNKINSLFDDDNFEENHFNETNQKRAATGLPPLKRHEHLSDFRALKWIAANPIADTEKQGKDTTEQSGIKGLRLRHPVARDIPNRAFTDKISEKHLELAEIIAEHLHAKKTKQVKAENEKRVKRGLAPLPAPKPINIMQAAADIIMPNSRAGAPPSVRAEPQKIDTRETVFSGVNAWEPRPDTPEVRSELQQQSKQFFDPSNNSRVASELAAKDLSRRAVNTKRTGDAYTITGDRVASTARQPEIPSHEHIPSAGKTSKKKIEEVPQSVVDSVPGEYDFLSNRIPIQAQEDIDSSRVADEIKKRAKKTKKQESTKNPTEKSMEKSAQAAKNPSFLEKRREGATAQPPKEEDTIGNYSEHMKEQKTINDKPYKQQGFGSVTKLKNMVSKLKKK